MTQFEQPQKPAAEKLGISGKIARYFQDAQITPLLALMALLMGLFAILVTPREEEPQIDVTMANVLIPFPGARVNDVEQMVSVPAEQVLSQMAGVEHVTSVSTSGMAVITVQFEVGVPRTRALVELYNTIHANQDWLPKNLGVGEPVVKPKGIDDVPILTATLYAKNPQYGAYELERVAHTLEAEIKHVPGTREVVTLGGPGRAINVMLDPARMAASGVTLADLRRVLQGANVGAPLGETIQSNQAIALEAGRYLANAKDVADLVVGVHDSNPVFLGNVAEVKDGPPPATRYVWHGSAVASQGEHGAAEYPAVTIAVTKKPGQNAVDVSSAVIKQIEQLQNVLIPADVGLQITRNYGDTANEKAQKLIHKLIFVTLAVVALVFMALGRREAAIVGIAVILTLAAMLFASWAWGFTLNRVSLFALIFSIGILVDDAIVVVENVHRHMQLNPGKSLLELIPNSVDEVGGPTILATLAVIAALLPMAFVSGLMGPYMSPIPINASMGMLISLAVAFTVTPWLCYRWLKPAHHESALSGHITKFFQRVFTPLLDETRGNRNRRFVWLGVAGLIVVSLALPMAKLVVLKMLPFDNKSEFQVVVDMAAGAPPEKTASVLHAMTDYLATVPEVAHYQAYVGLASPINFNGLVRQYYMRSGGEVGDIQVNLVDKSHRSLQSHAIANRIRPDLQKIADEMGAKLKVVEVPPGPPVLSPIVAEIYGPDQGGREAIAHKVRQVFAKTADVVDIDESTIAAAPKQEWVVDRRKAALLGVSQEAIVSTLRAGLSGEDVTYLHDASKYPAPIQLRLPAELQSNAEALLKLSVRATNGKLVPISELVSKQDTLREQPIYHKDMLPVNYVVGNLGGHLDSPLYGLFSMRSDILKIKTPGGGKLDEYFIHQPAQAQQQFALKWDGEWQVTYETFRDMGAAYAVGLILIYLLVVAQFGSYLMPLVIMAPIPLTIIGVMPGHALLGAQFTATSMIGMIALAGIIVRNSILLVDFIRLETAQGRPLKDAVINSAIARTQPILLTALSAILGALFILDDPIFNGLAISLIFGIFVSTLLTLIVIPLLYYAAYCNKQST